MTPENLFVAPEGAMQWERLREREGTLIPIQDVPVYWVMPGKIDMPDGDMNFPCCCTQGYPVIRDSLPKPYSQIFIGRVLAVCECYGRIIE